MSATDWTPLAWTLSGGVVAVVCIVGWAIVRMGDDE